MESLKVPKRHCMSGLRPGGEKNSGMYSMNYKFSLDVDYKFGKEVTDVDEYTKQISYDSTIEETVEPEQLMFLRRDLNVSKSCDQYSVGNPGNNETKNIVFDILRNDATEFMNIAETKYTFAYGQDIPRELKDVYRNLYGQSFNQNP